MQNVSHRNLDISNIFMKWRIFGFCFCINEQIEFWVWFEHPRRQNRVILVNDFDISCWYIDNYSKLIWTEMFMITNVTLSSFLHSNNHLKIASLFFTYAVWSGVCSAASLQLGNTEVLSTCAIATERGHQNHI